jgi:hypothetical protein
MTPRTAQDVLTHGGVALSPHEAIARGVIRQRTEAHHHAPRSARRHTRVALVLRRLAERLDPSAPERSASSGRATPTRAAAPHAGTPRPWAPVRHAAHRHHS